MAVGFAKDFRPGSTVEEIGVRVRATSPSQSGVGSDRQFTSQVCEESRRPIRAV